MLLCWAVQVCNKPRKLEMKKRENETLSEREQSEGDALLPHALQHLNKKMQWIVQGFKGLWVECQCKLTSKYTIFSKDFDLVVVVFLYRLKKIVNREYRTKHQHEENILIYCACAVVIHINY